MRPSRGLLCTLALALLPAAPAAADPVLPDLVQEPPSSIGIDSTGPPYHLIFASASDNAGPGVLEVDGSRQSTSDPMVASQLVQDSGGGTITYPAVGAMQYVDSVTHMHFHYLGFEHYELRRPSDDALVGGDHKTGFCLSDDFHYNTSIGPPGGHYGNYSPSNYCQSGNPSALSVVEGISVGWQDDYSPAKEGQYVDVTGLPAGDYWLVHHVNEDGSLHEADYFNDASSALVRLSWPNGTSNPPQAAPIRYCMGRDSCPATDQPPAATTGAPSGVTMTAATLNGLVSPSGLDTSYHFEWGTTTSYGTSTMPQQLAPATNADPVSATLTGVLPGVTYHYRVVATNAAGTSRGADATFMPGGSAGPSPGSGGKLPSGTGGISIRALRRLRHGRLKLRLTLPSAGALKAIALAHGHVRAGTARGVRSRAGTLTIVLRPTHAALALLRRRAALPVSLALSFSPPAGPHSTLRLHVSLRR